MQRTLVISALASFLGVASQAQTFLIDFGPAAGTTGSPDANGNAWNNFQPGDFFRLFATDGAVPPGGNGSTGIGFGATTPVGSAGANDPTFGLENPSPGALGNLAIQSATIDACFRADDGSGAPENLSFELSNLNLGDSYNIRIFGSRDAGNTRVTEYTVTGGGGASSLQVTVSNNETVVAEFFGVSPNPNGTIQIDAVALSGGFTYVNAMEISVGGNVEIVAQPESAIVDAGGVLSFSIEASNPAATIEWRRDGVPLVDGGRVSGAGSETLVISDAALVDVGVYDAVVSADGNSAVTDAVVGSVRPTAESIADFDENGVVDFLDVVSYLRGYDAAL